MLDYGIIGKKQKTTIIKDGEQFDCLDLLTESFNKSTTLAGRPIVVNKHYVARPDLISLAIYSTDKYASNYSEEDKAKFIGYMEHQLGTVEPEVNRDELREVFLGIYANPVLAKEDMNK